MFCSLNKHTFFAVFSHKVHTKMTDTPDENVGNSRNALRVKASETVNIVLRVECGESRDRLKPWKCSFLSETVVIM